MLKSTSCAVRRRRTRRRAFHIIHAVFSGFVLPPFAGGKDLFALEVDGVPRAPDLIIRDAIPPQPPGSPTRV